ncbi:MAG: S9 family peptidase [Blastocatellia bacterium]|nr:S9 family peptidase [Blastocatellia bacterium]
MNIWVKRTDEPFEKARLITADTTRPIRSYFWSRDGKYILFVNDFGGDENFNVYAVDPSTAPSAGADAPAAKNLTDMKRVRAMIYDTPRSDPDVIYVGLNDRDARWHDLYKVRISTGERTLVKKNDDRFDSYMFDNSGVLRAASRAEPNGESQILSLSPDGKAKKIHSCTVFETCYGLRFDKANKRLYAITNAGNVDLSRLVLIDPETGNEEAVESDQMKRVDFGEVRFSDLSDEVLYTTYEDDKPRYYFKDKAFEADYNLVKKQLGGKQVAFGSSTRDEAMWIVTSWDATEPGETYLFDRRSKKLTKQYTIRQRINREHLAETKVVRYKSSDGLEIPAYLTLPKGVPGKNLPTIIAPHGGPWARDNWGFDSYAQFAANRGYAVLQPNFRGSTGYGKKFLDAGNGEWGDKMQDDITWGVKYLVEQGIADPERVGIWGGSYGGYATLAGVTYTPDLYAAAVAEVAPSSLITLLETVPPYWESFRPVFYKRMGDPKVAADKDRLLRQSPLSHVAKIKTPLMITQGANDPRVNKRESDQIVIALRERNYPVEYIVAPDEGHGYARPVNNMAVLAAAEKFLAKHLGGRYQETMTPAVEKRLKEITVDPKTVTLANPSASAPTSASGGLSGKWVATVKVNGQVMEIEMALTQSGTDVSGTTTAMFGNGTVSEGKVSGSNVTAIFITDVQGQAVRSKMEGKVDGDKMSGKFINDLHGTIPFVAVRKK